MENKTTCRFHADNGIIIRDLEKIHRGRFREDEIAQSHGTVSIGKLGTVKVILRPRRIPSMF